MKKIFKYLFILLAFTFCVGYSSWVTITGVKTDSLLTMIETKPVCYLANEDGSSKRYFSTVEKALSQSEANKNQQIVILKTKGNESNVYTITENCTVKKGTTLIIPYYRNDDTNNTPYVYEADQRTTECGFAYNNPSTYLTCELRLGENKTLTNNGTIKTGGIIGAGTGNTSHVSSTVREYGQFTLMANSSILNYGNIENYGYIFESTWCNNSKVYNYANSYYYSLFTLGEFRGGSITYGMYRNPKASPFNRFSFANCTSNIIFDYSSRMKALCTIYAGKQYNNTEVFVVSTETSALIQLKPNSRLEFKLNRTRTKPTNENSVITDFSSVMIINFYGDFQLNSLKLNLKLLVFNFNIDTSKVLFPISHMLNIYLHAKDGGAPTTVTLNQQIKVMPGSEFYIDKNVTVSGSTIVVTDSCADNGTGAVAYPSVDTSLEKGITSSGALKCAPGYLVNSGVCNVTNLGGYVRTSEKDSIMVCSKNTVTSYELTGFSGSNVSTKVTYASQDFSLVGDTYSGGAIVKKQNLATGAYKSNTSDNVEYGWETTTDINKYIINFDANGGDDAKLNCDPSITFIMIGTSHVISNLSVSDPTRKYYDFDGWYLDSACTQSVIGTTVNKGDNITVYAKWKLKVYTISYYGTCDGEEFGNFTTSNISSLTYDDLSSGQTYSLSDPTITNSTARFFGWYKDNDLQYTISQIDLSLIDAYEDQGIDNIIIFGKFSLAYLIRLIINDSAKPYDEKIFYIPGDVLNLPMFTEYFDNYSKSKYFEGWYYDSNLTNRYENNDETDPSKIYDEVKLYGKLANKDSSFVVRDKNSNNVSEPHTFYFHSQNITKDFEYTASLPNNSQFGNWSVDNEVIGDKDKLSVPTTKINDYASKTILAKYKYKITHDKSVDNKHYVKINDGSTVITLDSGSNAESGSKSYTYILEGLPIDITIPGRYKFGLIPFNRSINIYKYGDQNKNILYQYTNSSDKEITKSITMWQYPVTFEITEKLI